jgi:biopolymer transport protein ExbD
VPKVKKKRMSFVIDMTPLVDITFLLLTFLMFTAQFKSQAESEQTFSVIRPEASADTSKLPEKDLAIINVAINKNSPWDTAYYFGLTNRVDWDIIKSQVPEIPADYKMKNLIPADTNLLRKLIRATINVRPTTKFALDADRRVRLKWIEDVMKCLRIGKANIFNFVTEKRKKGE